MRSAAFPGDCGTGNAMNRSARVPPSLCPVRPPGRLPFCDPDPTDSWLTAATPAGRWSWPQANYAQCGRRRMENSPRGCPGTNCGRRRTDEGCPSAMRASNYRRRRQQNRPARTRPNRGRMKLSPDLDVLVTEHALSESSGRRDWRREADHASLFLVAIPRTRCAALPRFRCLAVAGRTRPDTTDQCRTGSG